MRLSLADLIMVVAAFVAWCHLGSVPELEHLAPLPLHLVATFLCFCNIFRIGTRAELVWVATFVLSWAMFSIAEVSPYPAMLWTTVPSTMVVIAWSAFCGAYNGVGHAADRRCLSCSMLSGGVSLNESRHDAEKFPAGEKK